MVSQITARSFSERSSLHLSVPLRADQAHLHDNTENKVAPQVDRNNQGIK
jgi:hypothetical protein